MLELEKLYQIKKYFWLLYSTKEKAEQGCVGHTEDASTAIAWAKNCMASSFISRKTILFPIEMDGDYVKVVSTEGVGWIIFARWAKGCFEELKETNQ